MLGLKLNHVSKRGHRCDIMCRLQYISNLLFFIIVLTPDSSYFVRKKRWTGYIYIYIYISSGFCPFLPLFSLLCLWSIARYLLSFVKSGHDGSFTFVVAMLCAISCFIESGYIENIMQCYIETRHTGSLYNQQSWLNAKILPKYLQLRHQTVPTSRVYSWQQDRSYIDYI